LAIHQQPSSATIKAAAAYREAGHAVTAWHHGIILETISIHRGKKSDQNNVWNHPMSGFNFDWIRKVRPEMLIERLALVCLAGPVAERRFHPRGPRESVSKERIQCADDLLNLLLDSREKGMQKRRKLEAKAEKLMRRRDLWEKTEYLAGILLQKKMLSGDEATRILNKIK
jgi:hypothetical protein